MSAQDFTIVIPARYASSRFPGKPLAKICGQPMLWHVYQRALEAAAREVIVATDDERIADAAAGFGADVCMTSADCPSGTDRIAEVAAAKGWSEETIVVNLQGDEPLTPATVVHQVANNLYSQSRAGIATLCSPIEREVDFHDPNVVKVLFDTDGRALYFSRAPIPFDRNAKPGQPVVAWRHIGIYAYRVAFLQQWTHMAGGQLEGLEKLEQLRALQNGVYIHVAEAAEVPSHGIDTPQQLQELEEQMQCQDR
ncbi:MAG TPA: 3-deoxy-manno-octulosonate cytidylyltransferase [Gammaproteobacteria bacterium]|jgi:3-deoxy-manno-octulosonate cytidylyltransferase (CMP-KDO synthetase)|nr:3-deoxy-manno-octulosonate cytidylyltransferase [Gammaproteobacteria bacterium]